MDKIEEVARALEPLVNEDMDPDMRSAWLRDLAQAAAAIYERELSEMRALLREAEEAIKYCDPVNGPLGFEEDLLARIDAALQPNRVSEGDRAP